MDTDDPATQEQLDMAGRSFKPVDQVKPGIWAGMGHFGMNEAQTGYDIGPFTPLATGIDHGLLYGSALFNEMRAFSAHREQTDVRGMSPTWRPAETDEEAKARDLHQAQALRELANRLSPNPQTTGGAYRLVHSLADFGTKLAVGSPLGPGGMAFSAGSISAYEGYHSFRDQGVDEATAERLGGVEGVAAGLFGLVPGAGTLLGEGASAGAKMLFEAGLGVGANTGLGAFNRYADHRVLENAGYSELAQQYAALDGSAMFADAVTGLLPAGLHLAGHATTRALRFAAAAGRNDGLVNDAVDTVNLARAQAAAAPGVPVDAASTAAHQEAMDTAREQVLTNRPVDLAGTRMGEEGASFVTRGREDMNEAVDLFAAHLREAGMGEQLDELARQNREFAERVGLSTEEPPAPFVPERYEGLSPTDREAAERADEALAVPTMAERVAEAMKAYPDGVTQAKLFKHLDIQNDLEDAELEAVMEATMRGEFVKGKGIVWRLGTGEGLTMGNVQATVAAVRGRVGDTAPEAPADKQLTAKEKKKRKPKGVKPSAATDSIIEFLAKHSRGLDRTAFAAEGIDPKDMNSNGRFGIFHAFKKGGMGLDEATELMREHGYLTGFADSQHPLLDALALEMRGQKQHSLERDMDKAGAKELQRQAHFEQTRRELVDEEPEAANWPAVEQEIATLLPRIADEGLAERLALEYEGVENEAAKMNVFQKIKDAYDGAVEEAKDHGERTANAERGGEAPPPLELPQESAAELATRGRAESERSTADQQSVLNAAERARGDADLKHPFSLTGSDRASDANPQQADIFAKKILEDRPDLKINGANGHPVDAAAAVEQAKAMEDQASLEAKKALDAAKDCLLRGDDA